jgi:hypothetical protein
VTTLSQPNVEGLWCNLSINQYASLGAIPTSQLKQKKLTCDLQAPKVFQALVLFATKISDVGIARPASTDGSLLILLSHIEIVLNAIKYIQNEIFKRNRFGGRRVTSKRIKLLFLFTLL